MNSFRLSAIQIVCLFAFNGSVLAQDSDDSEGTEEQGAPRTETGECFTTSAVVNMTVLNDRAIYVQTRARHFLLTPHGQCDNLRRAYNRNAVRFVPFGRRICPGDGTHFLYEISGREAVCPIGSIIEMNDRAEVREFADQLATASEGDPVITTELDPADRAP